MKIGIIGVGIVGGALAQWLEINTNHLIVKWDPMKGLKEDLRVCDAIFICIPVRPAANGQDQSDLEKTVNFAKSFSENVFIRSTVLPGTNDRLGTIACPEFLTARVAHDEMDRLPILVGDCNPDLIKKIFESKPIYMMRNKEAELSKFAHNCFGAMKVTYFNIIHRLSQDLGIDYENVRNGILMSSFINEPHTMVPGPDGKFGYGGACFPENMKAMTAWLSNDRHLVFHYLFSTIEDYNTEFRMGEK